MKRTLYLAYGSNMNVQQMAWRCPTAKVVGAARLKGYRLLFRGRGGGAVATVEPFARGRVPVLLWSITPRDETALDRYEGWPSFYRKETVEVEFGGETVTAMVYIMNDGHPLGAPSRGYYDTIKEGYETAGFDISFLRKAVKRCATMDTHP